MTTVLDSSAFLAWVLGERGWERVEQAFEGTVVMHAVNWAEVLSKLAERGVDPRAAATLWIERGIVDQALSIDLGHADDAVRVAELRPSTRGLGLSLGDRYCLALGQRLGATVLTADRPWTTLTVGIMVEAIR